MLSQRTNLLLSPVEHAHLVDLARKHDKTMGELIRYAIKKTYKIGSIDRMVDSLARVRELTKGVNKKGLDYRKLVVVGRRYG